MCFWNQPPSLPPDQNRDGGTMKIIAFIDKLQVGVIQKILTRSTGMCTEHCEAARRGPNRRWGMNHCGLWNNPPPHPPPTQCTPAPITSDTHISSVHVDDFCQIPLYSDEDFSQELVYTQYNPRKSSAIFFYNLSGSSFKEPLVPIDRWIDSIIWKANPNEFAPSIILSTIWFIIIMYVSSLKEVMYVYRRRIGSQRNS